MSAPITNPPPSFSPTQSHWGGGHEKGKCFQATLLCYHYCRGRWPEVLPRPVCR